MTDNGKVTISVGSISGVAIFVVSKIEIDETYNEIALALIPLFVSILAILFEWGRLKFGLQSRQELLNLKAQKEHQEKYDKKIAICERALKMDLTDEQKAEYREEINKCMKMKLADVTVVEVIPNGKPDFS